MWVTKHMSLYGFKSEKSGTCRSLDESARRGRLKGILIRAPAALVFLNRNDTPSPTPFFLADLFLKWAAQISFCVVLFDVSHNCLTGSST